MKRIYDIILLCILRGYVLLNYSGHNGSIISNRICVYFYLCSLWLPFLKPLRHKGGIASNKIDEYFSLCSLWLLFLKPQRAQRGKCIRLDLQIFFLVLSVVAFFETAEGTEVEFHRTRSMYIFLSVLCGYHSLS